MTREGRAAVVGGGSWGTTLANILSANGYAVDLWLRDLALADEMRRVRRNTRYLPEFELAEGVNPVTDLGEAVVGTSIVISCLPSHSVRDVMGQVSSEIPEDAMIVSASKGIEQETLRRMTQVLADVLGDGRAARLAVLSGPSFAVEVCRGVPTAVTVASEHEPVAEAVRQAFFTPRFRVYTSSDVVGVELGGAVKNVVAIATGIADGLEYGYNARAALITRGLAEISRLGMLMGGERLTFMGLAGLGDLVLTCTGDLSRNRTVGLRLGQGETLYTILDDMKMVAEGVKTTRSVRDLAERVNVEMPIVDQVYEMLYHDKDPRIVVDELMTRESKPEFERR